MPENIQPHYSARKHPLIDPDVSVTASELVIESNADVSPSELRLLKSESVFNQAYERKRRAKDNSASTCEALITEHAVRAGFDDQTICNLIIGHKHYHGDDFESDPTYYTRMIAKARAREEMVQSLHSYGAGKKHTREEALRSLSMFLETPITSVQRFDTDPRTYVMRLGNGSYIEFKTSRELLSQAKLAGALIDYAGIIMPTFKHSEWMNVKRCIAECIVVVEGASEATNLGAATAWLSRYIRRQLRPEMERDGQMNAAIEGKPAVLDGHVWFSMDGLRRSIMLDSSEQPPAKAILSVRLKQIGCEYNPQMSLRPSGECNTSRSLWLVPDNLLDGELNPLETEHI